MMVGPDKNEMVCREFRDLLYRLQADELPESRREACQRHLDRCPACVERFELEAGMAQLLRQKLGRVPAPPGLETRIRAALRNEFGSRPARSAWFRTPWFAATAAAVLLVALLVPGLPGPTDLATSASAVHVIQEVTVVDHDCDKAGKDPNVQRRCTHPLHVNALKLPGGGYWTISPGPLEFRRLLLDAESRGRRFEVEGDYYPGPQTIVLGRIVPLDRDHL